MLGWFQVDVEKGHRIIKEGEPGQAFYVVMEEVPGITLDDFMQLEGCGRAEAAQILHQLISAVAHMHATGVCHRDLRLRNVMLREGTRGCVKLIDFANCGPADKPLTRRVPCAEQPRRAPLSSKTAMPCSSSCPRLEQKTGQRAGMDREPSRALEGGGGAARPCQHRGGAS